MPLNEAVASAANMAAGGNIIAAAPTEPCCTLHTSTLSLLLLQLLLLLPYYYSRLLFHRPVFHVYHGLSRVAHRYTEYLWFVVFMGYLSEGWKLMYSIRIAN